MRLYEYAASCKAGVPVRVVSADISAAAQNFPQGGEVPLTYYVSTRCIGVEVRHVYDALQLGVLWRQPSPRRLGAPHAPPPSAPAAIDGSMNMLDPGDGLLAAIAVGVVSSWAANCFHKNRDAVRNLSVEDTAL